MKLQLIIAAILGFFGVAIGAIGAHALKAILESVGKAENFETANRYHWCHTFAIFTCAYLFSQTQNQLFANSSWFFLAGIVLFSGSLYAYSLTGIKVFAHITPVGGIVFLVAWIMMLIGITKSL